MFSLYLLGDIRDIREKRMKSEFSCMSYHQKNASVSFFVSISISLHIFLTFFMSFLVFIREDINFRGCWQPYHIITVLKTSRVCFTSSFSYSLLCVHPFCYYQHTLAMKCHPKMHFFFAHCGLVSNINSLLALQISKHFCNHPHR